MKNRIKAYLKDEPAGRPPDEEKKLLDAEVDPSGPDDGDGSGWNDDGGNFGDGDYGDPDNPDYDCATVGELRATDDALDNHLKDYQGTREKVADLSKTVDLLVAFVAALAILFALHLMSWK